MNASALRDSLRIWHPRYRALLLGLMALGALGAGLLYLENSLLKGLIESVTRDEAGDGGVPYVYLAGIFAIGLLNAVSNGVRTFASSRLSMTSRDDLEREVLSHLLHRDDAFFTKHSTGEILNRLEVDLSRIIQRRDLTAEVWWAVLTVLANLLFFGLNDWRLAVVVLVMCVAGTWVTRRAGRPVTQADENYFRSHDRVKMDLEDYLGAVPEIQVGGLFGTVRRRLAVPQGARFRDYMAWVRAYAGVAFYRQAWPAASFLLAVLLVLYLYPRSGGPEGLALIPVLIYAMPGIFANVAYLVGLRLDFELSANSTKRVLEYEALWREATEAPRRNVADPTVVLRGATYTYPAGPGETAGGITGVDLSLAPGTWNALVGGAGSGKSTLVNVLLGRVKAQAGTVSLAGQDLASAPPGYVPSVATLMPQRVVLIDDTLGTNVRLGRGDTDEGPLDPGDLAVMEGSGLAHVCRLKALEMRPVAVAALPDAGDLADLRALARQRAADLGLPLFPFETGDADPERPFFEGLAGGRTDVDAATACLLDDDGTGLQAVAAGDLGTLLAARARQVLEAQRHLLRIESHDEYTAVAPSPVGRDLWTLRREAAGTLAAAGEVSGKERLRLARIALTARPAEWEADRTALAAEVRDLAARHPGGVARLRDLLAGHRVEVEAGRVHPFLTWRDNLLFAGTDLANQRRRRLLDQALVDLMADGPWRAAFVEQGLRFPVGRNGSRLSGGQCQLVALNRALLRRTAILVLDEPTSALDPESRDRVASFLRGWRQGRVIVTISHDPHFVQQADRVHVMGQGRLEASGTVQELAAGCDTFRRVLRQGE